MIKRNLDIRGMDKNREKIAIMFKYYISNDDTLDGAKWQDHVLVCSIFKY